MKTQTIEIIALDPEGLITTTRDFDSLKEARTWVKEAGLSKSYWNRLGESETDYEGWAARNVSALELHKDGECVQEWTTNF